MQQRGRLNLFGAALLLRRHGVPVLDSYEASLQLHDGHVTVPQSIAGIIDCLHFCRPSLGEVSGSGNDICGMIAVLAELETCTMQWCCASSADHAPSLLCSLVLR
jgi:hypothetical protein